METWGFFMRACRNCQPLGACRAAVVVTALRGSATCFLEIDAWRHRCPVKLNVESL
jgi:hypothetical protein